MNISWVYSLNHLISPSNISWDLPRFVAKFHKLGQHERPYRGVDTSICTSTAYKGFQTPYIYIIWMWDEYGLGVQPQSPHFTMSYRLGVAQISDKIPKAWSAWATVRGGDTSICTSTAYKGCQTSYIYIIWIWDEYWLGLQPQSPHFPIKYQLRLAQICGKIPQAWSTWAAVMWWEHIHMHIHSI